MPEHRRINIFAGPSVGKSTLSAYIFFNMKMRGYKIELVQEYVKEFVYDKRIRRKYDQLNIFARQLEREERVLSYSDDVMVVTDCPFVMSIPYAQMLGFPDCTALVNIAKAFDTDYPPVNIFLTRSDEIEFDPDGRYQNSIDEARAVDDMIYEFLRENDIKFVEIKPKKNDVALDVAINGYPD